MGVDYAGARLPASRGDCSPPSPGIEAVMVSPTFLRDFYRKLDLAKPAEGTYYVPLYTLGSDPVEELLGHIEYSDGSSTHLFSGFRGTGKSTELLRLRKRLEESGYTVIYTDMEEYLNLHSPVDVTDFLVTIAGAFADALRKDGLLPEGPDFYAQFVEWGQKYRIDDVELSGQVKVGAKAGGGVEIFGNGARADGAGEVGVQIKSQLKLDPGYRELLQTRMSGYLGPLSQFISRFFAECRKELYRVHEGRQVVFILDSIEHIQGTTSNSTQMVEALERLFMGHAEKLRLPELHLILTIPPWLPIRAPGITTLYTSIQIIPCVRVRSPQQEPAELGIDTLIKVIEAREQGWRELLSPEALRRLAEASGGYLRDYFRLLRELMVIARGTQLPVDEKIANLVIQKLKSAYDVAADEDILWLARIARSHSAVLPDQARLSMLARFFDNMLVLGYREDSRESWYDVHPLVRADVLKRAEQLEKEGEAHNPPSEASAPR